MRLPLRLVTSDGSSMPPGHPLLTIWRRSSRPVTRERKMFDLLLLCRRRTPHNTVIIPVHNNGHFCNVWETCIHAYMHGTWDMDMGHGGAQCEVLAVRGGAFDEC